MGQASNGQRREEAEELTCGIIIDAPAVSMAAGLRRLLSAAWNMDKGEPTVSVDIQPVH